MNTRTRILLALLAVVAIGSFALNRVANPSAAEQGPPFQRGTPPGEVAAPDGAALRLEVWRTLDASLVGLEAVPGTTDAWVALDQRGQLLRFEGDGEPTVWLDLTDDVATEGNEQGLLGLAFAPDFATSRRVYVHYTGEGGRTTISRWVAPAGAGPLDRDAEEVLLTVEQPYTNHNGGDIQFGPDGYLWIALGDGGAGGDPQEHAERRETLLGTLLRLDVSGAEGYAIPPDNPYVGHASFRPEIYVFGLRNPWRFAFDAHDRVWIADVGQNLFEEVSVLPLAEAAGAYMGWNTYEGSSCYVDGDCTEGGSTAVPEPHVPPAHDYPHSEGCSVSGGLYYVGDIAAMNERYVFTDFCTGVLWGLREADDGWARETLLDTDLMIPAFAERDGEVYVLDIRGTIYRVRAT